MYNKLSVNKISYIRTITLPGFINSLKFTVTIFHFNVMYNNVGSKDVTTIMLPIYKSNRIKHPNFLGTIRIQYNYIFISVCCNIANYIDDGRFYLRVMIRTLMSGVFQKICATMTYIIFRYFRHPNFSVQIYYIHMIP